MRRVWDDFSPVAGQSFQYAYDPIGNRSTSAFGGDRNGWNLRPVGYPVNALNQYTQWTNTGYFEVLGVATATSPAAAPPISRDRSSCREPPKPSGTIWTGILLPTAAGTTPGTPRTA